jgi:hypothetical protein
MATINVYHDETNTTYQVFAYVRDRRVGDGRQYFLDISTNMVKPDGSSFDTFQVESLSDVAPDLGSPAADWTELVRGYVDYFVSQAELGQSSSSSSSSLSSSSSSSII